MPRALLLSVLSHQCLLLKAGFRDRYPHGWLVWEAGAWNVPEVGEELGATRVPIQEVSDCLPNSDDVLCFELRPAGDSPFGLGRAPGNRVVVNDATVSREHLKLHPEDGGWSVERVEGAPGTISGGEPLVPGVRRRLRDGDELQVGDARLTYHTAESFLARVQTHAESLARAGAGDQRSTPQRATQ
ncbi:MAG: FHA domain-containing protein [Myxococcaceae bacterium]